MLLRTLGLECSEQRVVGCSRDDRFWLGYGVGGALQRHIVENADHLSVVYPNARQPDLQNVAGHRPSAYQHISTSTSSCCNLNFVV